MMPKPGSGNSNVGAKRLEMIVEKSLVTDKALVTEAYQNFALKVSIMYFIEVLGLSKGDIIGEVMARTDAKKKDIEGVMKILTRHGGKKRADNNHVSSVQSGLKIFLNRTGIPIPYFIDRIMHLASIKPIDREGIPNFIDPLSLFQESLAKSNVLDILRGFAGCWDVYRIGTASSPAVKNSAETIHINKSFLNIVPFQALAREHKTIAEFSIYQEVDKKSTKDAQESRLSGIVTHADQFVTLIGEKQLDDRYTQKLGNIAVMMWPYPKGKIDEGSISSFSGIELVPNSDGNVIGAYFLALRIAGSDKMSSAEFEDLRNRKQSELGTTSYEDIKENINIDELKKINALVEISKRHLVFSATATSLGHGG